MTKNRYPGRPGYHLPNRRIGGTGCDIIRCAVPDMEAARALKEIKNGIRIPLIADIHFDYRLALGSPGSGWTA